MTEKYDFRKIELKCQKKWELLNYGRATDFDERPKHYNLVEFPYPSGAGLHVGHCMGFGASDAYCRMKRMQGYNVLFPIGWDAFGLPTENYAIKTGIHPRVATEQNITNFRRQMKSLGFAFDYSREVDTTDPNYYKWTQWIFLQFYKHAIVDPSTGSGQAGKLVEVADDDTTTPRLAYQAEMPINWCPSCKIGLANEEVINGKCERCGEQTEKRMQKQWMMRITAYSDRLIADLETVDYQQKIKTQQVNWIGRSSGSKIRFNLKSQISNPKSMEYYFIEVFTTRADTLFGCTYLVIAPESEYMANLKSGISNPDEVEKYISQAKKKSDLQRTEIDKEKTGVKLEGIRAINPINNREIDIYVADYVLASYGTGAVMAVPAHDQRDFEFAKKYGIEIIQSVAPHNVDKDNPPREGKENTIRNVVHVLLAKEDGRVLTLNLKGKEWGDKKPKNFIIGGIEEGETVESAAFREVKKETGYCDLELVKTYPIEYHAEFYAAHKDLNRYVKTTGVVIKLKSDKQHQVEKKEKDLHDIVWVKPNELTKSVNIPDDIYFANIYLKNIESYTDYGVLVNSAEFDGLDSKNAMIQITEKLKSIGAGNLAIYYKLRDWLFSRQHYWGEPIPIIHCEKCGVVPLDEKDLPLTLPDVEKYQPTDTGESPLATISDWVNVKCPKCGGSAKRETDTMPNWAGSSWYYIRYCDPKNDKQLASNDKLRYWLPVDLYNGGMEHTVLHLLYSRFWHKFLYDLGVVPGAEPYAKRIAHGIILGPDNRKMSKSFGNVINPDDIIKEYGADALRAYIMFIGPYDQESAWNMNGIAGVHRFLNRVWQNNCKASNIEIDNDLLNPLHRLIKGVTEDIEKYSFNTYVAKVMEFNNLLVAKKQISKQLLSIYCQLLSVACPHIAEEMWELLGNNRSITESKWPQYDKKYLIDESIEIVIQINGNVRHRLQANSDISDDELKKLALFDAKVIDLLCGKEIIKVIVVPRKLVNIVS